MGIVLRNEFFAYNDRKHRSTRNGKINTKNNTIKSKLLNVFLIISDKVFNLSINNIQ